MLSLSLVAGVQTKHGTFFFGSRRLLSKKVSKENMKN